MNQEYQLGIDVWEGQLEIDEAVLKANGVKFIFVRLNDMNGGHHKDENFDKQWSEAAGFYRAPYFVYNPWVGGQANFDWLKANMPADAKAVAADIEVVYSGISAAAYAAEVSKFLGLVKARWNYVKYTGEWFLRYLSSWEGGDYWWAQYPALLYPNQTTSITWDQFRTKLDTFNGPMNISRCPGTVKFWQCSADRFILPGSTRPLDVNVFFGDEPALAAFFGGQTVPPEPGGDDMGITNAMWSAMLDELKGIRTAITGLNIPGGGTTPDPGTEPPPAIDLLDYTGPYVGEFEVIDNGEKVKFINIPDSYDRGTSQMNYETAKWLQDNLPDSWKHFVDNKTLVQKNGLWFFTPRIYRGQKVRIAEINKVHNTGRVIGFSVSNNQPTTICVHSPKLVDWLFPKIYGQPYRYFYAQPWRQPGDKVPNAMYVSMALLKKVS